MGKKSGNKARQCEAWEGAAPFLIPVHTRQFPLHPLFLTKQPVPRLIIRVSIGRRGEGGGGRGVFLEPWNSDIFAVEPGA